MVRALNEIPGGYVEDTPTSGKEGSQIISLKKYRDWDLKVKNNSVMQRAGRASQGERTVVTKVLGQEQGEAFAWSLVRWG